MTRLISPLGYETVDIMLDMDDVITPWFDTVDRLCAETWNRPELLGKCDNWHMWEFYGRTQDEWGDVVESAIAHGLYTTVDPIPGAVEAMNRLRWFGHRVHVVTARGFMANAENIRRWTPEYLENFGAGYDTLTFAKDKVAAQAKLGLTFDYAIDDGGHNYDALADAEVNVWMCKAVHNVNHRASQRVDSLWDFANMVLEETVPEHILSTLEATG